MSTQTLTFQTHDQAVDAMRRYWALRDAAEDLTEDNAQTLQRRGTTVEMYDRRTQRLQWRSTHVSEAEAQTAFLLAEQLVMP